LDGGVDQRELQKACLAASVSAKPDCQPDTIKLNGEIYPLVRQSPNEFEWTEAIEVTRDG